MRLWEKRALASLLTAIGIALSLSDAAAAHGSLAEARDLYTAAAYDEALTMLNGLQPADQRPEDGRTVDQYRALCLLALGRMDEATKAIQAVVAAVPSYRPSGTDVSPRVRAAFHDVRQQMLPGIIQQRYADAKMAFDRKSFATASEGFAQVLELLADADLGAAANQPPLSQVRVLAMSFRDLTAAAQPPAATVLPAKPAPAAPVPAAAPTASRRPAAAKIYSWEDADVVPPIAVRETMPVLGDVFVQRQGTVEIIIDENGLVERATMTVPVNAVYDGLVLQAVKGWRFRPATVDGVPVKFRNGIPLDLKRR